MGTVCYAVVACAEPLTPKEWETELKTNKASLKRKCYHIVSLLQGQGTLFSPKAAFLCEGYVPEIPYRTLLHGSGSSFFPS